MKDFKLLDEIEEIVQDVMFDGKTCLDVKRATVKIVLACGNAAAKVRRAEQVNLKDELEQTKIELQSVKDELADIEEERLDREAEAKLNSDW